MLAALGRLQARRPSIPIALCLGLAVLGLVLARGLELRTRFDQLLPETQPSVVELNRVLARTSSASKISMVLEGPDHLALRACGDALVPALRAVGAPITTVEDGVHAARSFLLPRSGLFATLPDLQKLDSDFEARWDWEVSHATGSALDDDEPPPPFSAAEIEKRFKKEGESPGDNFPEGYFEAKDGSALVVLAQTQVAPGDLSVARATLDRVKAAATPIVAGHACEGVKVGYAGDLVTSMVEYSAIRDDLLEVGALGIGLVLVIVLLFYFRLRALVCMGITVAVGLAYTFGLTRLVIGHLNVATGFLISIVAGNGINAGIIYMARYFEEVRGGADTAKAIDVAHRQTAPSTLTAAVAAAAAYGSLWVTDFKAFKHFAFIGGAGILVCWAATYALTPALLVVFEGLRPFRGDPSTLWGRLRLHGVRYDAPFAAAVPRAPRLLAALGVAVAVFGVVASVVYVRRDPMEYDLRRVRGEGSIDPETKRVSDVAAGVIGGALEGSMVVLVDRVDEIPPLKKALEAKRDAAPPGQKPFEAVHSLYDFVPEGQADKVPVLLSIRERLLRARRRNFVADADWTRIEESMPPEDLQPFGVDDLPEDVKRGFRERDGTLGRLVLIEPTKGELETDLRYLLRWAASFRETRLATGETVRGSGRAVIFADILRTIVSEMPLAILLSFGMTLAAVVVTFRRRASSVVAVIGSVLVGCAWLGATMMLSKVKLNMFNFVALPITFGIGAEYAVNLVQRYEAERELGVVHALRTTGGAVVLCSLTTVLGYLALVDSMNPAIRSLGWIAFLGEACCLIAALAVLPAILLIRDGLRNVLRP